MKAKNASFGNLPGNRKKNIGGPRRGHMSKNFLKNIRYELFLKYFVIKSQ